MSEHQWKERQVRVWLAERDEVMRNPTPEAARTHWDKRGFPPPLDPLVPLAALHKARLQWLDATDAMLRESADWLAANGYEATLRDMPPLTPERRDAERKMHGMLPLGLN